ncbi:MAG: hypothetical protein LAO07_00160 [Acidobacteriia bacterium]|nr:hypothetical protein [Terriglobia bacterium]
MPSRLSAVQAVTPAFEQTKQQLFKPFRFRHWLNLATISLVTGEFVGGGGGGGGWHGGGGFPPPRRRGGGDSLFVAFASPTWDRVKEFLPWILLGVAILIVLFLLWLYAASVYRFILFDSVLYNRCELRKGWQRWKLQGYSYFLWMLGLAVAVPAILLVLVGVPIFLAWRAHIFDQPREHLALLILGGAGLLLLFLGLLLSTAIVALFAKDFVVPVMAMENLGVLDAWRRVLPMLGVEKMSYVGYVLMKIVLAVGSAIIFGILYLLAILILLIPTGILGVAVYFLAKAAGLTWTLMTMSMAVILGGAVVFFIFYVIAFISAPAMVFFQSYTLHFFGSRYPALGAVVFPPSPPPPPSPAAPTEPLPLPAG